MQIFKRKRMNKKGMGWLGGATLALAVVVISAMLVVSIGIPGGAYLKDKLFSVSDIGQAVSKAQCPTDGATTLSFSVQNTLNTSGSETFDTTYRFTDSTGETVAGTDSTAGSVSLNCGETYKIHGTSSSGADGDSAEYVSVIDGNAKINSDGTATFMAVKDTQALILGGRQHGVLEMRAKDIINDGFMFDDQDNSATDYETDGVTFNSTVVTTKTTAVGSGGEFHIQLYYRPTVTDNIWGDVGGHYLLVDAGTTVWEEPTMKVNGKTLVDVKGQLNPDESKAYNGYEYVYLVTEDVKNNAEATADMSIFAIAGVDPGASDDIQIDIASRGAYTATSNSNEVKVGAVKDDSSQTQVHTLIDTTFDIS